MYLGVQVLVNWTSNVDGWDYLYMFIASQNRGVAALSQEQAFNAQQLRSALAQQLLHTLAPLLPHANVD
eukprot:9655959-Lingulodinium_polyedra.AAC.1